MEYARIREGKITIGIPKIGTLKDGSTVSGYNLLDYSVLKEEGWLPYEDIKPDYDPATHYLENAGHVVDTEKIAVRYLVKLLPPQPEPAPPQPSELDVLKQQVANLQVQVDALTGGTANEPTTP
jgi:hypothetical protein